MAKTLKGWAVIYGNCANVAATIFRSKKDAMEDELQPGDVVVRVELRETSPALAMGLHPRRTDRTRA